MLQKNSNLIKVVGFDPSLRNWGICVGTLDLSFGLDSLKVTDLKVNQPILSTGKQVRQNSLDLSSAEQLTSMAYEYAKGASAVFVEVPVGSQSARAMASYGICVGVLGALRTSGIPFFELTPTEVKVAATGKKTATKEEMITWGTKHHPEAPWPTYTKNGEVLVSSAQAEHMADALACIYAGIKSQPFQQMIRLRT